MTNATYIYVFIKADIKQSLSTTGCQGYQTRAMIISFNLATECTIAHCGINILFHIEAFIKKRKDVCCTCLARSALYDITNRYINSKVDEYFS